MFFLQKLVKDRTGICLLKLKLPVQVLPKRLKLSALGESSVAEPELEQEPELEPEPVKPKIFFVTGAGTGAVISNFGSGSTAPKPKLSFEYSK